MVVEDAQAEHRREVQDKGVLVQSLVQLEPGHCRRPALVYLVFNILLAMELG